MSPHVRRQATGRRESLAARLALKRAFVGQGGSSGAGANMSELQDENWSPASGRGPNRLCQVLDLYWRSPEFGDVWYESMQLEKTICCGSKGGSHG